MNPMIIGYLANDRFDGLIAEAENSRRRSIIGAHKTAPRYAASFFKTVLVRSRVHLMVRRFQTRRKPLSPRECQPHVTINCR
jgi:hypothetical protein